MITWIGFLSSLGVILGVSLDSQYGWLSRGQLRALVIVGASANLLVTALALSARGL